MSNFDQPDARPRLPKLPNSPFLLHTSTLTMFMAASAVPTPLYRLYQHQWHFSPALLTGIFGIYALCLLLSLLVFGSLSDHVGRRPVILGALGVEIVAILLFLWAQGPLWLVAARSLQGLATGAALGTLSASLIDVDARWAPLTNSVSPMLGLAFGALGCSALVDWAPAPLHFAFVVVVLLFGLQFIGTLFAPETGSRRPGAWASLRPRVSVPASSRRDLLDAAPISIAGWALGGFYLSLIPSLVQTVTGSQAALTSGLVVAALAVTGAAASTLARPYQPRHIIRVSALMLSLGVAVTLFGVAGVSVPLMVAGTVVAGVGFGAGFLGALRTTMSHVAADDRAELMSALLVVCYLSFSLPAIAAGLAIHSYGIVATALGYGALTIALALLAFATSLPKRRPSLA